VTPAAAPNEAERPAKEGGSAPRHVAIIMDGNGRWAKKRGLPRVAGHRAGAEAVRRTMRAAVKNGVEVLTLYAFSSENWRRTEEEVSDLKGLLGYYLERELDSLAKEGVKLRLIGDYKAFGPDLSKRLEKAMERLQSNSRLTLVVALNYGSRAEIAAAALWSNIPSTTEASSTFSAGSTTPSRPAARAASVMESAPRTGRRSPSRPSSPSKRR